MLLPGESQGRGSLVGCRLWGRTELDTTAATQQQQHVCIYSWAGSLLLRGLFSGGSGCGLLSHCSTWASHCSGFSAGVQVSILVARGLRSCDSQSLWCVCLVVAYGLSCPTACGIFLDQGLNLCSLNWQVDSQPLDHQGSLSLVSFVQPVFEIHLRCCIYL